MNVARPCVESAVDFRGHTCACRKFLILHIVVILQCDQTFDLCVQVYETFGILNRQIGQNDLTIPL